MPINIHTLRHGLRTILGTLTGLATLLFPAAAQAQGQVQPFGAGLIDSIAMISTMAITGLHMMTWVIFFYLNILLSPTFIFDLKDSSTDQTFMNMLNIIWQLSRDLVNIVFAFALIGVAIITIVMAKKDYVAEHWRKFVLAIILVNFSWLFPRLIIDAANIAAATVYGVPSLISTNNNCTTVLTKDMADSYPDGNCQAIPDSTMKKCDCFFISDLRLFLTPTERAFSLPNQGWSCPLDTVMCFQKQKLDASSVAAHSAVINGLVVNHARLQALAGLPPATGNNPGMSELMQFVMRELMVMVFHVMLLFPLLALFVAFIIRIPVLWLTIAFMPFYFLGWVLPEKFTGGYTEQIMQYFLKAAFLPAIVGIPLTVGFIMVNAGTNLTHTAISGSIQDVTMNILPGINNMWEILWMLISMGVVWVGVFTVLESMGKLGMGSAAIKGFGQMLGGIALKAPLALPIMPSIGGKSLLAIPQTLRGFSAGLSQGVKLDELLKGNNASNLGAIDAAARKLANRTQPNNGQNMNLLSDKLADIANKIRGGENISRADIAQQINGLRNETGITVKDDNFESVLRELKDGIVRHGGRDQFSDRLENGIQGLTDALRAPPPANPPQNNP